jgi:4-alpha-glucanotransferase
VIADRLKPEPYWDFRAILEMLKPFVPKTTPLNRESLRWAMIQMVMNSPGNTAIFPMQDLLGLGKDARMNFPGHTAHNWVWRLHPKFLTENLAQTMYDLTSASQRRK